MKHIVVAAFLFCAPLFVDAKQSDFSIIMKNMKTGIVQYNSPIPADPVTIPKPSPNWECIIKVHIRSISQEAMALVCCVKGASQLSCVQTDVVTPKGQKTCSGFRVREGKETSDVSVTLCGDLK